MRRHRTKEICEEQLTLQHAMMLLGVTYKRLSDDSVACWGPASLFGKDESEILRVLENKFGLKPSRDELQLFYRRVTEWAPPQSRSVFGIKTFQEYILTKARVTNDPYGDFVMDARRLYKMNLIPDDFDSWSALLAFMRNRGACREALEASRQVWMRFERWRRIS